MTNIFKLKLLNYLETKYGVCFRKIIRKQILNKKLFLIDGTVRETADYDDAWSFALACNSEIIFDVGANIGQSSIPILCSKTIKKIVLIDPNPKALSVAAENVFLNNLSANCIFISAFASNSLGDNIDFWTIGCGAAGSVYESAAKSAKMINSCYNVPTITLDYLCEYYGLTPDYTKIDVEGAEIQVLEGAVNIAAKSQCKFLVEMHSSPELTMRKNALMILEWCDQNKYNAYYLKEHILLDGPEMIEHRGRCHLLLLPEKFDFPKYLININQGDGFTYKLNFQDSIPGNGKNEKNAEIT